MTRQKAAVLTIAVMATAGAGILIARAKSGSPSRLGTRMEKVSYGMGVALARGFQRHGSEIDEEALSRGMRDALAGEGLLAPEAELRAGVDAYQAELRQRQARAMKETAEANEKQGEAFLAANAKEEGVTALPSGLQYKVVKAGDGKRPAEEDVVECSYRAARLDGTVFQSSDRRGQPVVLKVAGVIPGLKEALKLMPVGSRWQVFLPPQLAYGQRGVPGTNGAGARVGPNATVVYDLELHSIRSPEEETASAAPATQARKPARRR